jgi:hypothetical protein
MKTGAKVGVVVCARQLSKPDRSEFVIDPYNTPETLAIWTEGSAE